MGRINGVAWCTNAVMEAAARLREASTGTASVTVPAQRVGFNGEGIALHLESTAFALEASGIAHEVCSATGACLRALILEVQTYMEDTAIFETLEHKLTMLEKELFVAIAAAAPNDLLMAMKERANRELQPFRNRLDVVHFKQMESQFLTKQLLIHYNLPRLSLFYMD